MEAVIEKLNVIDSVEQALATGAVYDGDAWSAAATQIKLIEMKVNEIIDRLNDEPTLVEVAEALKSSDFPSDKTLVVSLERARKRWEEARR